MQSTLQYNHDYLVCGNHNYMIVILSQYYHTTKQSNENTITNLFALQCSLHLTKHYIKSADNTIIESLRYYSLAEW